MARFIFRQRKNILVLLITFMYTYSFGKDISEANVRNELIGMESTCDEKNLFINLKLKKELLGSVYARGYPSECMTKGENNSTIQLILPTQECGIHILKNEAGNHQYEILLYIQYDPYVQQVIDEQVQVTCKIENDSSILPNNLKYSPTVNSLSDFPKRSRQPKKSLPGISHIHPASNMIQSKLQQMVKNYFKNNKKDKIESLKETKHENELLKSTNSHNTSQVVKVLTGNHRLTAKINLKDGGGPSEDKLNTEFSSTISGDWKPITAPSERFHSSTKDHEETSKPTDIPSTSETSTNIHETISMWMDILPGKSLLNNRNKSQLKVGQTSTLVIRSNQVSGLDTRVTTCSAHDGSNKNTQELIDAAGCSVDKAIMPDMLNKNLTNSKEQIRFAPFKAFKFPDHDYLHIRCIIIVCKETCGPMRCEQKPADRKYPGFFLINQNNNKIITNTSTLSLDNVVDRIELFNSVEIRAPRINIPSDIITNRLEKKPRNDVQSNAKYCISTTKLTAIFGTFMSVLSFIVISIMICCIKERVRRIRIRRAAANRAPHRLPRVSHLPSTRFYQGYHGNSKISYISGSYDRFHK